MTDEKLWRLALCSRCKTDFESSGYTLIRHGWQEIAEACEFCQVGRGFDYDVFRKDGRDCL